MCCDCTEFGSLALIAVHLKPENVVSELNELAVVHEDITRRWSTNDVLILGDFNADCSYLSQRETDELRLRNYPNFHWLIPDDTDTTVTNSDCAYDRYEHSMLSM